MELSTPLGQPTRPGAAAGEGKRVLWDDETLAVGCIVALVLAVNLATASFYPVVWVDEVMFTDPAYHLASGAGFHTTAWPLHDRASFFAGYPPLYPALLAAWMKLTQFSPAGVRSLNHVLVSFVALLVWLGAVRTHLVAWKAHRVLLAALVLLGYGMSIGYRSGRPDTLMALLVAGLFVVSTLRAPGWRYAGLLLTASALPFAGIQALPYAAMMLALLFFFLGARYRRELLCIGLGVATGAVALVLLYLWNGSLERFIASMRIGADVSLASAVLGHKPFHHENTVPKDFSLLVLATAGLVLLWGRTRARARVFRTPLALALTAVAVVPFGMILTGKFPTYYAWMVYLPLAVAVCGALPGAEFRSGGARAATLLALGACVVGLPLQLAYAAYDARDRDYAQVAASIPRLIEPQDWVYGDYAAYYAARANAEVVFTRHYLPRLTGEERRRVSVMVVDPADALRLQAVFGGEWRKLGPEISPRRRMLIEDLAGVTLNFGILDLKYRLQAYRRADRAAKRLNPDE